MRKSHRCLGTGEGLASLSGLSRAQQLQPGEGRSKVQLVGRFPSRIWLRSHCKIIMSGLSLGFIDNGNSKQALDESLG